MDIYLLIVTILSAIIAGTVIWATRGIQYYGMGTDNEIMKDVAAKAKEWKWPSRMYRLAYKSNMKNVTIILLALFQKIWNDKRTDHPYVALNAVANVFSSVLIYLILKDIFEPMVGFYASLLFIVSPWIWQMAIFVGHTLVANVFFLLSVLFALKSGENILVYLILSGICFGLLMFSSPSSRKYIIPFLGTLFYGKYLLILSEKESFRLWQEILGNHNIWFNLVLPIVILAGIIAGFISYKKIITKIYNGKATARLNKLINAQDKFSVEHYIKEGKRRLIKMIKKLVGLLVMILAALNLIGANYLCPVFIGFVLISMAFIFPDVKQTLKGFFDYYYLSESKSRFRLYPIYFGKHNRELPCSPIKRVGWSWFPRFFKRMVPVHLLIFILGVIYLVIINLGISANLNKWLLDGVIVLFALSPFIYGELTKSPPIGRTYFPGMVTSLIFIAYILNMAKLQFESIHLMGIIAVVASLSHALYIYIKDILPSRMSSSYLVKKLKELGINKFYTYDTAYNNAFVNSIDPEISANYDIKYIKNLNEAEDGWVVIPGTSSKAFNMESEMDTILDGDFRKDKILNKLLDTKEIEKIAEAKFKTFGSSYIWHHESEITSYRDLILKEITKDDRFKGYGWLVHISKLRGYFEKKKVLICGASGFIGRNLFETLSKRDDLIIYGTDKMNKFNQDKNFIQADLTNRDDVRRVVEGMDVIIQAAAVTSGAKDILERPYIHVTDNVIMNSLLFQAAYDFKVGQVIFFSCTVAYQPQDELIKETDMDLNKEMYPKYFGVAWMKTFVEKLCQFYGNLGRTKYTVIRHSNIYGPYDKYDLEKSHVFGATITKVMTSDRKIVVWGEGKEVRDLLHISDLIRFVELSMERQQENYNVFNVGLGQGITISELVKKIVEHSEKNLQIEYDTTKPTIPTKVVLDISKAKQKLGWQPEIDLDKGIKRTLNWYRENIK